MLGAARHQAGIEKVQGPSGDGGYSEKKSVRSTKKRKTSESPDAGTGRRLMMLAAYRNMQSKNENQIAKSVIANTAGYTTGAAFLIRFNP